MKKRIELFIKRTLNYCGIDIKVLSRNDFNIWLKKQKIGMIIDIGANRGQFALSMRKLFPYAKIISFEPLSEEYSMINNKFIKDTRFESFNLALGNSKGEAKINRNKFSPSSSLLSITENHTHNFPKTATTFEEIIHINTLDDCAKAIELENPLFIKIDVQGYEKQVIMGGIETLKKATFVLIELSFQELYVGQSTFHDIYSILHKLGFEFRGVYNQLISPIDRSILQIDGLFIKK